MMMSKAYATTHVAPNCDQRTKDALQELVDAVARQHGLDTPVELILIERRHDFPAEYLRNTEAFDS